MNCHPLAEQMRITEKFRSSLAWSFPLFRTVLSSGLSGGLSRMTRNPSSISKSLQFFRDQRFSLGRTILVLTDQAEHILDDVIKLQNYFKRTEQNLRNFLKMIQFERT